MFKNQLIDFAMKVTENVIWKQNALSNENVEINAKLHNIDITIDKMNKENNLLWSMLSVAENASSILAKNHHKHTKKMIDLERDLQ